MKIGTILKPGIEADDLNRIIKEDFEMDSMDKLVIKEADKDDPAKADKAQAEFDQQPQKTYDFLTNEKLFDALFTLADNWCPSIDEYEYREFFHLIRFRLKYQGMQDNSAYDVLS